MDRLKLADQLPYRFHSPRMNPRMVRLTRGLRRSMLRGEHRVERIDVEGIERIEALRGRGDGVMIAPNHSDRADGLVLMDVADRISWPFYAMVAYQIFEGNHGLRRWLFPRLGIFPVDREGADLSAIKAAVNVLVEARNPLLVFPEGEVYHLADRLTPLREGVGFLAASAAKKAGDAGRTVWVVPVGMKYRFVDGHDPMPALGDLMGHLESRFTWWPASDRCLVDRIHRYAEGLLGLKEIEYLGQARPGPLKERIAALRSFLLDGLEARHLGKTRAEDPVPSRVKDVRRCCLEKLAADGISAAEKATLRKDLNDAFVAIQLYSYPGDYLRDRPTAERAAEVLMKFEEDALGAEVGIPQGPRRVVLRVGEPIDAGQWLKQSGKLRPAVASITNELQARIQSLLDQIPPGRTIPAGGE